MADIKIVLTFDDGPQTEGKCTQKVLDTLDAPGDGLKPIKAAFFVQTHSPNAMGRRCLAGKGRESHRCPAEALVQEEYRRGHVVGIHTGSTKDHACHKNRVKKPADPLPENLPNNLNPANGLDSDMIRAKAAIAEVTREVDPHAAVPKYVRAPYGVMNPDCQTVYLSNQLKHIYWDVVSGDAVKHSTFEGVQSNLEEQIKGKIRDGEYELIILFHDPNVGTAEHLGEYIQTIKHAAESAVPKSSSTKKTAASLSRTKSSVDGGTVDGGTVDGGTKKNRVIFTGSRTEVEDILERRARKGDDLLCPPGLP
jgi:peptidoglycan/xylan/chitin deacetylase (PgdA/CDA1 family)